MGSARHSPSAGPAPPARASHSGRRCAVVAANVTRAITAGTSDQASHVNAGSAVTPAAPAPRRPRAAPPSDAASATASATRPPPAGR